MAIDKRGRKLALMPAYQENDQNIQRPQKSHYLEFEEETDEEIEQDIADDPEDHNDNIPYAEESDFEDDTIYTEERKPIPKIIPKKKKAPFNVEAFAKECNAYVVKQERQEEQENLQH